uniref:Thioredoxin domain-containing protein n=1 Tax=viral metagenome TaxID=1070528 RepID=A0A6C0FC05_9ZZZZ|tara:strand:- start:35857 stop:36234 length:378 start_codon:yes stop_codon:yes gene_type:complete
MSQEEIEIVTEFESRHQFMELLQVNPGYVVVKFGADWCGPCKKIEHLVKEFFTKCPNHVVRCDIDVDESFDLYAFMKTKKMVNGIPVVLVWKEDNTSYIPDFSYVGGDPEGFTQFASQMLQEFSI